MKWHWIFTIQRSNEPCVVISVVAIYLILLSYLSKGCFKMEKYERPFEQARLREAFRQGIDIVRLEGWEPQADFYIVQERVIAGELTIDEAVKIVLSEPLS